MHRQFGWLDGDELREAAIQRYEAQYRTTAAVRREDGRVKKVAELEDKAKRLGVRDGNAVGSAEIPQNSGAEINSGASSSRESWVARLQEQYNDAGTSEPVETVAEANSPATTGVKKQENISAKIMRANSVKAKFEMHLRLQIIKMTERKVEKSKRQRILRVCGIICKNWSS
ncbi:uncharacterized protein LOC118433710 [Folsomia candida]|uniref:uncharacterized protein LOC118433710 n=1 Tax=Folsomia candida TaxID=158441 RepID=UPI001604D011|nr:uncharacterized protein LOC118433710 [Folsomia candida]